MCYRFLLSVLGVLMVGSFVSAQTLFLNDGTEIEGEIRRIDGSRVTIMSSSGVATYEIMEFDENTRNEYFHEWQARAEPVADPEYNAGVESSPEPDAQAEPAKWEFARGASFYIYTILFVFVYAGFALGALLCFFGRRWFRQLMALLGVCLGGGLGWLMTRQMFKIESLWISGLTILIIAILLGLIFAAGVYVMIFLNGFSLGALAANLLWIIPSAIGIESPGLLGLTVVILGIAGGIIALNYRELILAIATAFWGASLLVYSVFGLIGALVVGRFMAAPAEMMPPVLELMTLGFVRALLPVAALALTDFGTVFQLRQAARSR